MDKLTLRNPAHVMPSVWTEDGEECVSDRVFNGWGPKIVRAVNAHDDLLAACMAAELLLGDSDVRFAICDGPEGCGQQAAYHSVFNSIRKAIKAAEAPQ